MKKKELQSVLNEISQGNMFSQLDRLTDEQRKYVIKNLFTSKMELIHPNVFQNHFGIQVEYGKMREDYLAKTYVESQPNELEDKVIILNDRLMDGQTEEEKKKLEEWIHFALAYEFIYLLVNHHKFMFNYEHWLRDSYFCWEEDVIELIGYVLLDAENIPLSNTLFVEKGLEELCARNEMPKRFVKSFKEVYKKTRRKK